MAMNRLVSIDAEAHGSADRIAALRGCSGHMSWGRRAVARLSLCSALLGGVGCASWFQDDRPWFVNSTSETLEVQSTHTDGHTLKIMLYPGSRVPLGAAQEPVREIAVRRASEPQIVVPESEIRSCLEEASRECLGWEMNAVGLEPIGQSDEAPASPADDAGPGEGFGEGDALRSEPDAFVSPKRN